MAVQVWPDSLRFQHAVEPSTAMAGLGCQVASHFDPAAQVRWHSHLQSLRRLSAAQQVCRASLCAVCGTPASLYWPCMTCNNKLSTAAFCVHRACPPEANIH